MEKVAKTLAGRIYRNESGLSFEVYQYGLQVALEMLVVILTSCCIAIYLDMKMECCVFLAAFSVLRSYAGGLHFSGFIKCFLCSSVIVSGALLFVKTYTIPPTILCLLMGLFTMAFFVAEPVNSKNKLVTEEESKYYKKKLRTALALLFALFLTMLKMGWVRYANLIVVTTIITFALMLIGRWKDRYMCEVVYKL